MATDTLQIFGTEYTGVTGIKVTDSTSATKTYIRPLGTLSITANSNNIDVTLYAAVNVIVYDWELVYQGNVTITSGTPNYIVVNNYTNPFLEDETYRVTWDGTPYICDTFEDTSSTAYDGYFIGNTALVGDTEDTGEPFFLYRSTNTRLVGVPEGSVGHVVALTIEKKVTGSNSSSPSLQAKTGIIPSTTAITITADSGYDGLSSVLVVGDADLVASNIKSGITIFGVTGTVVELSDVPTFTVVVDSNWTTVQSVTCNKTYSDCYNIFMDDVSYGYLKILDGTYNVETAVSAGNSSNTLVYYATGVSGIAFIEIDYSSTELTSWMYPIPTRTSSSLTSNNLTVTVPWGYYDGSVSATLTDSNLAAGNIKSGVTIFGVTGSYSGSGVSLLAKTGINPSTSSQTVTADNGYDGLSSVLINAMPSGSASGPSSVSGTGATVSTGTNTISLSKTIAITPTVSAGYITTGTSTNATVTLSASVTTKSAAIITPTTANQTITSGTYLTGTQTIAGDTNLVAGNIKSGTTIFGVTGTYTSSGESSKNIQYSMGRYEVSATSYTATNHSIKVSKAGSYKCYWVMDRNTTSGTTGTQLYKNGSAVGSAHTSWTYNSNNRNGMNCEETLTFAANDTIVVRARSRSTSYICGVSNFIIVEQ